MATAIDTPQIISSFCKSFLYVDYKPKTQRSFCDICDFHGRILKTSKIEDSMTEIDIRTLQNDKYILLILDGDKITNQMFVINR